MAGQRGEYKKSARRREEILDAAFVVFSRSGYNAATMSEIAREVGMSQPGLLHHYGSKLELLQAVFERRDQMALDILSGRRDIEFLRGLVEISRRNHAKRHVIRLYTTLAGEASNPDHPARGYFEQRFELVVGETERAFADCAELGILNEGVDPHMAALSTVGQTEGMQLLWLTGYEEIDMAEVARTHIQQYLSVEL